MRINGRYVIHIVVAETIDADGNYGDIFNNFDEFLKAKPGSQYQFGFIVFDVYNNCIPEGCSDFCETADEAFDEWMTYCT